jgi:hypothetical protein
MYCQPNTLSRLAPVREDIGTIRDHIARAAIGRTVDLRAGTNTVIHGIVTGVFKESGHLKIVVGGRNYDTNQILTIVPTTIY